MFMTPERYRLGLRRRIFIYFRTEGYTGHSSTVRIRGPTFYVGFNILPRELPWAPNLKSFWNQDLSESLVECKFTRLPRKYNPTCE